MNSAECDRPNRKEAVQNGIAGAPRFASHERPCEWVDDGLDIFCARCGAIWDWQCEPMKRR